ncbi:uncharacterized protein LOC126859283 [Cataglyphis hispanica]|uniref:uncharacterized protein LOC126859283 n=1 Tax=Cataglyphis hispanica TaxID=1086592 RepID=UPI0021801BFF|nr:uncharacterized protein LOC126859283 [Cataglyphis hispanica]
MADKKHVLHLPKDYLNTVEIAEEFFSPICEFSAIKEYLSSPTEYFSPYATPQTSRKEILDKKLNSNMFKVAKKISEKNENQLSLNDSSNRTEMDFTRSKYHNNVDPAIEELTIKRMMPNSSTPKNSRASIKRVFSPNYCSAGKANEDPAMNLTRKRLDASFSSPKALASREQSVNSSTWKVRLTKEIEPLPQMVQALSRSQKFTDPFLDDEKAIASSLYKDVIYVSEMHFLLMASNRNRRMRMTALRRRARIDSRDSAFSEFMESDSE